VTGAVFALDGVGFRRQGRAILSEVSLRVERGERWVVLGPNGAGKTTLLRILSTYLRASSGTVDVLGCRMGRVNVEELRPRIGYLSPALAHEIPEQLTPRQIVDAAQVGAILPWYVDAARISAERTDAALAQVGFAQVPHRPFSSFSSGEQLRIQLARALVTEPQALLLDEPMASLDVGGRASLLAALARISAGTTEAIVMVVHRLEDIPAGTTHVLLLRGGRVLRSGPVDAVLTDAHLSDAFGTRLRVHRSAHGWSALDDH
jgi:iron complex transport system ATP-binding protein